VVVSCTGTVLFLTVDCWVVVVVVAGTGFSTTVVHELKSMAAAKSGVRMISFFIVGLFLHKPIDTDISTRCLSGELFSDFVRSVVDSGAQFLGSRALPFRFQNPFFQTARPWPALPSNLFAARDLSGAQGLAASLQRFRQTLPRQLAIHRLRTGILNRDANACWPVPQSHRSGNLVDVLTAGPAGASKRFLQVGFAQHGA
jgi:hypothetical protein